ncbi:hypothetical protein ABT336_02490 [Micromonospora sp. NPDC000207]|uniref:hypothetical protein n=1 Tax=Micromonospora sp. NPDC000207 TaxID=3154246 RepID=UPI00331C3E31
MSGEALDDAMAAYLSDRQYAVWGALSDDQRDRVADNREVRDHLKKTGEADHAWRELVVAGKASKETLDEAKALKAAAEKQLSRHVGLAAAGARRAETSEADRVDAAQLRHSSYSGSGAGSHHPASGSSTHSAPQAKGRSQ